MGGLTEEDLKKIDGLFTKRLKPLETDVTKLTTEVDKLKDDVKNLQDANASTQDSKKTAEAADTIRGEFDPQDDLDGLITRLKAQGWRIQGRSKDNTKIVATLPKSTESSGVRSPTAQSSPVCSTPGPIGQYVYPQVYVILARRHGWKSLCR